MSRSDKHVSEKDGIGARLRIARQKSEITVTEMAKSLGYSKSYISSVETGRATPTREIVEGYEKQLTLEPGSLALFQRPLSSLPWNIPYEANPFFTGRNEIIDDIDRALSGTRKAAHVVTLTGLGGIGKTQVALEYVYRFHSRYTSVFWLNADAPEILKNQFLAIGDRIYRQGSTESEMASIEEIKQWLRQNPLCLIIIDSLDDPKTLEMSRKLLSHLGNTRILITTRLQTVTIPTLVIELEKMNEKESALLLLRRINALTPQEQLSDATELMRTDALTIARVIDGLPLAIDQAASYILETGCKLSHYYTLFLKGQARLLKERGNFFIDHPDSVYTTWSLALKDIERTTPSAIELIHLCAFLYPDDIYTELFVKAQPILDNILKDQISLYEAISALRRYSLLQMNSSANVLRLHRLVQVVVKASMNQKEQREWVEKVVRLLNYVFPRVESVKWIESRAECKRYLLQTQAVVESVKQWRIVSREAAQLLSKLARYLLEISEFNEAEHLCLMAIGINNEIDGLDIEQVIADYGLLASVYEALGKTRSAEKYYKEAIKAHMQVTEGQNDYLNSTIVEIWSRYATLLAKTERTDEALGWKEQLSKYFSNELIHEIINDDQTNLILYQGQWTIQDQREGDYGGNVHYTEHEGASFEHTFKGVGIGILCDTISTKGVISIYIDGHLEDEKDTSKDIPNQKQAVVFYTDQLSNGPHKLRVEMVQGSFALDALAIFKPSSSIEDF